VPISYEKNIGGLLEEKIIRRNEVKYFKQTILQKKLHEMLCLIRYQKERGQSPSSMQKM
jgi:hypothetical protein